MESRKVPKKKIIDEYDQQAVEKVQTEALKVPYREAISLLLYLSGGT